MVIEQQEGLFPLLQFVALALPAIAIYLQVLVSIYQTEKNVELKGSIPHFYENAGGERNRVPEHEPNVIESLPSLVTEAGSHLDFVLSLASIVCFLLAGLVLTARLLVSWGPLISTGLILVIVAMALFAIAILSTVSNCLSEVLSRVTRD